REKEPQGNRRAVHGRGLNPARGLMNLVAAQVLAGGGIRRAAQKFGKLLDVPDIIVLRLLGELADAHVLNHATTQRADGFYRIGGGHRRLRFEVGVLDTLDPQARLPARHLMRSSNVPWTSPNPGLRAQRAPARAGSFLGPQAKSGDVRFGAAV